MADSQVYKGTLVPLGNGFSLAIGKHPNKVDDIDIGPNNKYGLSVNHGEILQNTGNSIRIFSAEKMLGGLSPAQLLYRGANPNMVFAAQEAYKKTHRLNDDGTHYKKGGSTQTPVKENNDNKTVRKKIAYGNNFDSRMRYLNLDKKLVAYINKLSKDYNIPPAILTNRLFHEGAIDKAIKGYEATLGENVSFLGLLDSEYNPTEGFSHYGLDTSFDEIKRGAVKLKRPIFARKQVNENEHGTPVNSVEVYNHYDAIETMAARLAYDREKLKADYPNVSDKVLDQMTISAYNKGLGATYKDIKNNNLNKDYIVDDRLYNINYENDFYKENKDKKYDILSFNDEEIRKDNINKYMANDLANTSIRSLLNPTTYINSYKNAVKKDSDEYLYPIGTEYGYNNAIGNELIEFKLGGQTTITSPNSLITKKNNDINHSILAYDKNKLGKVISHINIENPLGTIPNVNSIKQMSNKKVLGGENNPINSLLSNLKRVDRNAAKQAIRKNIEQAFKPKFRFKGGDFGGSGASGSFDEQPIASYDTLTVRNTPLITERSFSKAYSDARKKGLKTFKFNGKDYSTDYSTNPNYIGKRSEITGINIREVLDKENKPIKDSTRVEPYVGQIPGEHQEIVKRKKYGGSVRQKCLYGFGSNSIPTLNRFRKIGIFGELDDPETILSRNNIGSLINLGFNIPSQKTTKTNNSTNTPINALRRINGINSGTETPFNLQNGYTPHTISSNNNNGGNTKGFFDKFNDWLKTPQNRDYLAAGVNTLGSIGGLVSNIITANSIKHTPNKYALITPGKLKTKFNINPQISAMKSAVSQGINAANRTSASSRGMFQKVNSLINNATQQTMNLYGQKENLETELINKDTLNQQSVRAENVKNVINTINKNISESDAIHNQKAILKGNTRVGFINNLAGIVAGPNGLIARKEARDKQENDMIAATLPYAKEVQSLLSNKNLINKYRRLIQGFNTKGKLGD